MLGYISFLTNLNQEFVPLNIASVASFQDLLHGANDKGSNLPLSMSGHYASILGFAFLLQHIKRCVFTEPCPIIIFVDWPKCNVQKIIAKISYLSSHADNLCINFQ